MNTLYLIRGLPGSGKTTLAKTLAQVAHFEADQFFTDDNEVYNFDPSKLRDAHTQCLMRTGLAMEYGFSSIAVSNTFSQRWEMEPYVSLSRKYDYRVTVIEVQTALSDEELATRNVHNCPVDAIARQRARWQTVRG